MVRDCEGELDAHKSFGADVLTSAEGASKSDC